MSQSPIKVYFTSKRQHHQTIMDAVKASAFSDGIHINARWLHFMQLGDQRPTTHWLRENFDDAVASHFFVLYVEAGDTLKTSLVEVGHIIPYRKRIFIAGERNFEDLKGLPHKDLEPWCMLTDQIKITGSIDQTLKFIKETARGPGYKVNNDGSVKNG